MAGDVRQICHRKSGMRQPKRIPTGSKLGIAPGFHQPDAGAPIPDRLLKQGLVRRSGPGATAQKDNFRAFRKLKLGIHHSDKLGKVLDPLLQDTQCARIALAGELNDHLGESRDRRGPVTAGI